MNCFTKLSAGLLTTAGILGLTLSPQSLAQDQTRVDSLNQAELLRGLEVGNQNESEAFVEDNSSDLDSYNLSSSEQDIRLMELEEIKTWENTGDDEDTAVQVDVYDF